MYVDFVLCRTWHRNEQIRIRAPVVRLMSNKMQANFIILHNKQTRNWYTNKNVGSHSFVEARIRKIDRSIDANDHRILMQSKPTIYIYIFSMYQFNGKTILLLDYRFYFFFFVSSSFWASSLRSIQFVSLVSFAICIPLGNARILCVPPPYEFWYNAPSPNDQHASALCLRVNMRTNIILLVRVFFVFFFIMHATNKYCAVCRRVYKLIETK